MEICSEITNKQTIEIAKLNQRLNEMESMNDSKSTQTMKYDSTSNTLNMKEALQNVKYLNNNVTHPRNIEPPTKTLMDTDIVKTNDENTAMAGYKGQQKKQTRNTLEEPNLLIDASHDLEKIKMLIKRQEQMHTCGISTGDLQLYEEKHAYDWPKLLEIIANKLEKHQFALEQEDILF